MRTGQTEGDTVTIPGREDHMIAGFAALAIAIHILEAAFPSPLPGVKPGLANVVTVVVYLRYGLRIAAWVALLRVLVGSLLIGTFLSPTFLLSATGALLSLLVLGLVGTLGGRLVGALGLSVAAALAHMSGQIWVAYMLFIPHAAILNLVPLLLTAALVFGTVSGIIAASLVHLLEQRGERTELR
jgi:heptaprenyl diphosphate synthase